MLNFFRYFNINIFARIFRSMRPLHTEYTPLRLICSFHCTLYRIMDSFLFCWRFHMWVYVRLYSAFVFDRQCHCGDVNDSVKNLFDCFFPHNDGKKFWVRCQKKAPTHTHTWSGKTKHINLATIFVKTNSYEYTHISTRNTSTFTR